MTKILIISQNVRVIRELASHFHWLGFSVQGAASNKAAFQLLEEVCFKFVLLDSRFSERVSFYDELKKYRKRPPVVFIGDHYQEVPLLDMKDDFLLRPFTVNELRVTVNRILEERPERPIHLGDLQIDAAKNIIRIKDQIISLGKKEMDILLLLTKKAGKIVGRSPVLTVERVNALRKKLAMVGAEAFEIKSVGAAGYRLLWMNQG